jgi:hypothetical protein
MTPPSAGRVVETTQVGGPRFFFVSSYEEWTMRHKPVHVQQGQIFSFGATDLLAHRYPCLLQAFLLIS